MKLPTAQGMLAFTSIPPGISMLDDPSGSGFAQHILLILSQDITFIHDMLLVGIWLVAVYGILPIVIGAGLWLSKRRAWRMRDGPPLSPASKRFPDSFE